MDKLANYVGNYTDDLGNINLYFPISIYIINPENRREFTDTEIDKRYLPESYFDIISSNNLVFCKNPGIRRPRQFIFNLDNELELFATIPYLPGSQQFQELIKELNKKDIPFKYWGESLKDYWIEYNFGESK